MGRAGCIIARSNDADGTFIAIAKMPGILREVEEDEVCKGNCNGLNMPVLGYLGSKQDRTCKLGNAKHGFPQGCV